jgi:glycosyltransferase involved in cell wall biosynthesis
LSGDRRLAASDSRLAAPAEGRPALVGAELGRHGQSKSLTASRQSRPPKVALVHDWLTGMRGGEKVLDAICQLYPDATLYTLVQVPGSVSAGIEQHKIKRSLVQWLPRSGELYRRYLPLFPAAVELFDLDGYDLVISSSHCAVKSVIRGVAATHVCYCHSPMRYAWDQFEAYFGPDQVGEVRSRVLRPILARLARWDAATAGRVDSFLANSQYVAGRIRRYYNRGSTVVYPPVDTAFYRLPEPSGRHQPETSFLIVSALVPYKRLDVAIDACRQAQVQLKIVGRGPEEARLRHLAGSDVEFLGWRSDEDIRDLYARTTAVLLPGTEDFGMVPVEAQACGTPVVALRAGGACETVVDGVTGVLVEDESAEAFTAGLSRVRTLERDQAAIRTNAERFSGARFIADFQAAIAEALAAREAAR